MEEAGDEFDLVDQFEKFLDLEGSNRFGQASKGSQGII